MHEASKGLAAPDFVQVTRPLLVSRDQSNLHVRHLLMFQIDLQIDKWLVHKLVWPRARLAPSVFYTVSAIVREGTDYPSNQSLRGTKIPE